MMLQEKILVGYQDIEVRMRFYSVSADFLFGLTDNRQYRNVEVDKPFLSDKAIMALERRGSEHWTYAILRLNLLPIMWSCLLKIIEGYCFNLTVKNKYFLGGDRIV